MHLTLCPDLDQRNGAPEIFNELADYALQRTASGHPGWNRGASWPPSLSAFGKSMIVFDVDGTLVGGEVADWASFAAAFEEAAGFVLDETFFARIEEVTAQAIVHQALEDVPIEKKKQIERAVCQGYLRRLQSAHERDPSSFPAVDGALALLAELKERNVPVAIATGDWFESITFKLRAAGIPFDDLPVVTSSHFYSRADIIAGAIAKAGRPMHEAVYIGDGLWDLRASRKLGIPFIGVGHRRERLETAGATYTLPDLNPFHFWRVMGIIRSRTGACNETRDDISVSCRPPLARGH